MSPNKREYGEREDETMKPQRNDSRKPVNRADGELPAELKAFEARLAALTPRADRLDRDALLFEAGQASAEVGLRHRWAWPSAFGAMTTVAAVLLAVVLLRPEPQSVVKYVYVERPAEPEPISDEGVQQVAEEPLPEPSRSPQMPSRDPTQRRESMMAAVARDWLGVGSLGSTPRQRQLEALLAQGADAIRLPSDSPTHDRGIRRATDPQSYRQWRDALLEGATNDRPSAAPAVTPPLEHGAQS